MAKPTTYATPICIVLSLLVIVGIIWGMRQHSPLIITLFLLPAVAYEAYRTEGESIRWASWVMLVVIFAELILIKFKINYDLGRFFGEGGTYMIGTYIPFTDLKVIFPVVMVALSFILFFRTIGKYTKWLAVLIFVSSLAIVYTLDAEIFKTLLRYGTGGFGGSGFY